MLPSLNQALKKIGLIAELKQKYAITWVWSFDLMELYF